jgi:hypothetical protein
MRSRNVKLRFAIGSLMSLASTMLDTMRIVIRKVNNKTRRITLLLFVMIDLLFCEYLTPLYTPNGKKNKPMVTSSKFRAGSY